MTYPTPESVSAGETTSSSKFNKLVNAIKAIWKGAAAGDMDYYDSSTSKTKVSCGSVGDVWQVLSAGVLGWGTPDVAPGVYIAKMQRTASQAIPHNSATTIGYTDEDFDTHGSIASTGDERLYAPADGIMIVFLYGQFDGLTTEGQMIGIRVNGSTVARALSNDMERYLSVFHVEDVSEGDYVDSFAYQNNGSSATRSLENASLSCIFVPL